MSTWIASVYTVQVIMFPRGSANVYIITILLNLFPRVQPAFMYAPQLDVSRLICMCYLYILLLLLLLLLLNKINYIKFVPALF